MKKQHEEHRHLQHYRRIFKAVLFGLWVLFLFSGIIATIFLLKHHGLHATLALLKKFVGEEQWLIVLGICGVYFLRSVIFIPVSFLGALLGIVLEGNAVVAVLIAGTATILTSFLSFGIARALGRKWIAAHETPRLRKFDEVVKKRGLFTIFLLRILVFLPFDLINLASGFSAISFRNFAWGTFLGIWPEVATQVLIGNSFLNPKHLIILSFLFLGVLGVTYFFKTHPHIGELLHSEERLREQEKKKR